MKIHIMWNNTSSWCRIVRMEGAHFIWIGPLMLAIETPVPERQYEREEGLYDPEPLAQ